LDCGSPSPVILPEARNARNTAEKCKRGTEAHSGPAGLTTALLRAASRYDASAGHDSQ
jgi:hypothetical protein